jgi:hypothetical protein
MSSRIPTSASVAEAAVIQAPLSSVWHLIKLQDFASFWTKLDKSEYVKGTSPETDVVKWTFKDGTVLDVKLEEHSVRSNPLVSRGDSPLLRGGTGPLAFPFCSHIYPLCSKLMFCIPTVN